MTFTWLPRDTDSFHKMKISPLPSGNCSALRYYPPSPSLTWHSPGFSSVLMPPRPTVRILFFLCFSHHTSWGHSPPPQRSSRQLFRKFVHTKKALRWMQAIFFVSYGITFYFDTWRIPSYTGCSQISCSFSVVDSAPLQRECLSERLFMRQLKTN